MIQYLCTTRLRAFLWIGPFWLGLLMNADGQENPVSKKTGPEEGLTIGIEVKEVRLDAVVVDKKGRQITDLTADDFEIYQDGQRQRLNFSNYIADDQAQLTKRTPASQRSDKSPLIRNPALTRNSARRTIIFWVDDLSMSYPDVHNARMALERFVTTQMQPGDLVSIMQTEGGGPGLQTFTSNKRELLARIRSIRWCVYSNPPGISLIMGVTYCLRALEDMPGRKFLFLLSAQVNIPGDDSDRASRAFNGLADAALRAGVVIHTMDIPGLIKGPDSASMDAEVNSMEPTSAQKRLKQANDRIWFKELPLSQKTGGLFLKGSNFFANGTGDVQEEMKGYYLLSYTPPAGTFSSENRRSYHKIRIIVKRPKTAVHTRDGFFGTPGDLSVTHKGRDPLAEALNSPFRHADLKVSLASGYVYNSRKESLLRAWLHLDGQRLSFINNKDGSRSISLLAVAATSDINGLLQDSGGTRTEIPVNDRDIQWIRKNGIRISLSLPVKKPGAYYLRVAVKDQASGAIGSMYQFIDIPDFQKDRLSLSSIFILNRDEDASWIQSEETEDSGSEPVSSQQPARRSQAIRSYLPGESFNYIAIAYNARAGGKVKPELESRFSLFEDGKEVYRSKFERVDTRGVGDLARIPIKRKLNLDWRPPGDYVLQLEVRDKRAQKSVAVQTLDFAIETKYSAFLQAASKEGPSADASKTVIEMTPEELRRTYRHQLRSVEFSANQGQLDSFLEKVGKNVAVFFRDFLNTSSKEKVEFRRTGKYARGYTSSRREEYQYLILRGPGNTEASWVEDRVDKNNNHVDFAALPGFIMSSGYAGSCLYLHPSRQPYSRFRYLGRENSKSHAYIIAFAQKPESGDYLAKFSDSSLSTTVRFLVQGFVWIDPDDYQILRMYTTMFLPDERTGLLETTTDITYEKVRFKNVSREFWLPHEVLVEWHLLGMKYSNRHKYSDYHLFTIESDYRIAQPKVNK